MQQKKRRRNIEFFVLNHPVIIPQVLITNVITRLVLIIDDSDLDYVLILPWEFFLGRFRKIARKIPSGSIISRIMEETKKLPKDRIDRLRTAIEGTKLPRNSKILQNIKEGKRFKIKIKKEILDNLLGFWKFEEPKENYKESNEAPIDIRNDPWRLKRKA